MRGVWIALCALAGAGLVAEAGYMTVKAAAAQQLIRASWQQRDENRLPDVPWPWADTKVVAKLTFQSSTKSQMVMQDASGESLAFGPGMVAEADSVVGPVVIAGHRDTHFSYLRDLIVGEMIGLEFWHGQVQRYRVTDSRVINSDTDTLRVQNDHASLTLVTCWPFDALVPGGPERFIVTAEPVT